VSVGVPTRPPSEQWWTINGADIMAALQKVEQGDAPWVVYAELLVNSEGTDYGSPTPG
jgi:hypothetical protein